MIETESTHQRLVQEAAGLFAERGYGGTSMSEIASRVGVQKASLYNYYASKDDLLIDLLERSVAQWETACRPALEGGGAAESRLGRHLRAAVEFAGAHPQAVAIIRLAATQIHGELGQRVRRRLDEHEARSLAAFEGLFRGALETGEVEGASAREMALFWGAFVDGLLINQLFATGKAEIFVDALPRLWALFWRGLSGRAPNWDPWT